MLTKTGQLRTIDDLCVTVSNGKAMMQSCGGDAAQKWAYDAFKKTLSSTTDLCLELSSADTGLVVVKCAPNNSKQKWSFITHKK